jgi:hypothetical protein
MKNLTLSEMMHTFPLKGFEISGNFKQDIANYIDFKKIPIAHQTLDYEGYTFPLFRLSFGKTITVHTLTDGVVEKVKHTRIENMPNEIPNLMKQSFLIEARRDKPLFNEIYSIGSFLLNNEICLIVKTVTDNEPGLFCQHERASFDGRKIEDLNLIYDTKIGLFDPSYIQARSRKDTFAFAIIFSLMLEAERTPLLIETKNDKKSKKSSNTKKPNSETGWITKRVYIDKTIKYKNNPNDQVAFDKTDKHPKNVIVNGFLRKQHYGPEFSQEKWIYIESFQSTRWTNDKDKKIIVDIYDKK